MNSKLPIEIYGAWIATKNDIIEMNRKAKKKEWGACFKEENLKRIIDEQAQQLVVPQLVNHPKVEGSKSYRCFVWLKVAKKNKRICAMMDIDMMDIKSLHRPRPEVLHRIIFMLLECQHIINLDDINDD